MFIIFLYTNNLYVCHNLTLLEHTAAFDGFLGQPKIQAIFIKKIVLHVIVIRQTPPWSESPLKIIDNAFQVIQGG